MKKTAITLGIIILLSSMLSAAFFFLSGLFDMDVGYVTVENGNKLLLELNDLPFIYVEEPTEIVEINEIKTISIEGIKEIDVDSISTEIIIEPTDSQNASFNLVGTGQGQKLFIQESSDEIEVEVKYPRGWNIFTRTDLTLYVKIPKSYSNSLVVQSVSGEVISERLDLAKFEVETTSGEISLKEINSDICIIDTTSGRILMENTFCKKSNIETTSGRINMKNGILNDIDTISGDMKLENVSINQDVYIDSVSGDIIIIPTEDSSYHVNFDTVSGESEGFSPAMSGIHDLDIETISGDLIIK